MTTNQTKQFVLEKMGLQQDARWRSIGYDPRRTCHTFGAGGLVGEALCCFPQEDNDPGPLLRRYEEKGLLRLIWDSIFNPSSVS